MAISIELLVDSATVKTVTGIDADRKPTYGEDIYLERVRLWAKALVTLTDKGYQRADTATMFIDAVNSKAYKNATVVADDGSETVTKQEVSFVPAKGMKITCNGTTYEVRGITPCKKRGSNAVHHYELELV